MLDIYAALATIPWVAAHPIMLIAVVPAIFWLIAHIMTLIPPPTDKTNVLLKQLYTFVNVVIAANYFRTANAPITKELDQGLAIVETAVVAANTTPTKV